MTHTHTIEKAIEKHVYVPRKEWLSALSMEPADFAFGPLWRSMFVCFSVPHFSTRRSLTFSLSPAVLVYGCHPAWASQTVCRSVLLEGSWIVWGGTMMLMLHVKQFEEAKANSLGMGGGVG